MIEIKRQLKDFWEIMWPWGGRRKCVCNPIFRSRKISDYILNLFSEAMPTPCRTSTHQPGPDLQKKWQ
jgi:hypothetical protein